MADIPLNRDQVFLINHMFAMPRSTSAITASRAEVANVLAMMGHYGYLPSQTLLAALTRLSTMRLGEFAKSFEDTACALIEPAHLRQLNRHRPAAFADRVSVWAEFERVCRALGIPNTYVKKEAGYPSVPTVTNNSARVIECAEDGAEKDIYERIRKSLRPWTDSEKLQMAWLLGTIENPLIEIGRFPNIENGILLAAELMLRPQRGKVIVRNATDILRIACAMSGGDVSLRHPTRFAPFPRAVRKKLVRCLEDCPDVSEAFRAAREPWKRLIAVLHPAEHIKPRLRSRSYLLRACSRLYTGKFASQAGRIEIALRTGSEDGLSTLRSNPAEFASRLRQAYALYGRRAFDQFAVILPELPTIRLLRIEKQLMAMPEAEKLVTCPRGRWKEARLLPNDHGPITSADMRELTNNLAHEISLRLIRACPEGYRLDPRLHRVKIPPMQAPPGSFGRGTTFPIPQGTTFIRTFAANGGDHRAGQIGNGWLFFDAAWRPIAHCSPQYAQGSEGFALIYGDEVLDESHGQQVSGVVDLFPSAMAQLGVRYAVSRAYVGTPWKPEALALRLSWDGASETQGHRSLSLPVRGHINSRHVCVIDLGKQEVIYLDADLRGSRDSAEREAKRLSWSMPHIMRKLAAQPSYGDLFRCHVGGNTPALYDDAAEKVSGEAFVFKSVNPESNIKPANVRRMLYSPRKTSTRRLSASLNL